MKPILQDFPSIIGWELWKRRNIYKYGDAVSIRRVIYKVSSSFQALVRVRKPQLHNVPHKWPDLLYVLENYIPKLKIDKVMWEFPIEGWTKIDKDGASKGNPGRSAIGYCLRDEQGDIIHASGKEIQDSTNTEAEAVAILEALRYCHLHGISNIWLETNSMLLKNVIMENWRIPWIINAHVKEIRRLLELCRGRVLHIFREGNKLPDHLANYALDTGPIGCDSFAQLDPMGRRIVNDNKLQCPHLRIRVARS